MLQVKSLLKGSPAQTCDKIAIGDYIIAVNGKHTRTHTRTVFE
jgi:C-terminal processing protease CtpA/Prc